MSCFGLKLMESDDAGIGSVFKSGGQIKKYLNNSWRSLWRGSLALLMRLHIAPKKTTKTWISMKWSCPDQEISFLLSGRSRSSGTCSSTLECQSKGFWEIQQHITASRRTLKPFLLLFNHLPLNFGSNLNFHHTSASLICCWTENVTERGALIGWTRKGKLGKRDQILVMSKSSFIRGISHNSAQFVPADK